MSRIFGIVQSQNAPEVINRPVLDEDTNAMLVSASMESFGELQDMYAEVDRMADIQAGLESLAFVAEQIQEARTTELGLIDVAGDLAFAGTSISSEAMTPSLESEAGTTVSTEGIKTMAQNVWKAIKDFVKKIAKKVGDFFHKIFGTLPRLRKSLMKLKERADDYSSKSIEENSTDLDEEVNRVAVDFKAPANGKELKATLELSRKAINFVFDDYTHIVHNQGEVIKAGLKDFDLTKDSTQAGLEKALDKVGAFGDKNNPIGAASKALDVSDVKNDARFDSDAVVKAQMLPGNMGIFVERGSARSLTVLETARVRRARMIRVMGSRQKAADALSEASITTLTVSEIKAIADVCIDIIDGVEAWERGKLIDKVKKVKADIVKEGDKLDGKLDKADDLSSELRAYPKSALEFVRSYETWSSEPHTSLTSNGIAAVRAALVICNKSLSNYK